MQGGIIPYINLQFIVLTRPPYNHFHFGDLIEVILDVGSRNLFVFVKYDEETISMRHVHNDTRIISQLIGDRWGIDVHLAVTIA